MLDERKLDILRAIVTDYVSSQEPVGSQTLVKRHNLKVSPATVRNDMAVLEEEGYIIQPHTSAGRIPTDKGYRLFVDRLEQVKPLSLAERRAISTFMAGAVDLDDMVARTVRLLAQITRQVAIVQYPVLSKARLRHLEIVRVAGDRGILILVNSSGRLDQRPIDIAGMDDQDLSDLRTKLSAAVVGSTPGQAIDLLTAVLDELPARLRAQGAVVITVLLELLAGDPSSRIVVGGVPNLTRFADQFETTVKPVLEALEEQMVLLRLLGEAKNGGDVTVRIGHENPYEPLQSTSVVASIYSSDTDALAKLGIVGPTRMDYPSTIAAVQAVARYVGRYLAEG